MTMLFSVSAFAAVVDKTSLVGTSKEAWNAGGGPVNIDGISMPEKYETTTATLGDVMWQTVTGLENGTYTVELYANARFCPGRGFDSAATDGQMDCTFLFANDVELSIPVFHNADLNNGQSYTLENVQVTDGTLRMGMTKKADGSNWHTIQIKALKFHVDPSVAYQAIIVTANEVKDQKMAADVKVALDEALATYGNVAEGDTETMDAALLVLTPAVEAAVASVKKYADYKVAIDGHYTVLNSTNVYTQEAYDTFKAAADAYQAKYDEGTLTENVVNPCAVQGWHSTNIYDDFLLSAWGTKDFDTNLYINTWSVEGEGDGSNFKVPFFEYWTGDDQSLGATTKTATVTGLEAGKKYIATAWVRVRMKNGATAPTTGITLSVGAEGTPVDVAAGTQIGTSQFFIGEYTAAGVADAEGNLTINFNIAADNNISWLSFKNVNYAEAPSAEVFAPLAAEVEYAKTLGMDVTKWETIATTGAAKAEDIPSLVNELKVAEYNYVMSTYTLDATSKIGNIATWTGTMNPNCKGQHWDGTGTSLYSEQNANGWNASSFDDKSSVTVTLSKGKYVLKVAGRAAANEAVQSYIMVGETKVAFSSKGDVGYGIDVTGAANFSADGTYANDNKGRGFEWRYIAFEVTSEAGEEVTFTAGGAATATHMWFSICNASLLAVQDDALAAEVAKADLVAAVAAAQATVDAKIGVGDGVFLIPTADFDTYAAAVAAAQAVLDNSEATAEELNAAIEALAAATEAYAAAKTLPAADKTYTIKHNVSGLFMTLDAGVKLTETASIKFEDAGDGKYYIADADGEYAGYAGTNTWSMSSVADNKEAWTITAVGEGLYTIKGKNGFVGADDPKEDNPWLGSSCYGNKAGDAANSMWVIAESAMPEMEVTLINPAGETVEKMVEGDFIKFTTNIEPGYILVGVLQVNDATQDSEYLTSYRSAVKGETDWSVELYSTMKFREGHTYKFEFTAYESEDAYNQEPYDAPGSAAIGSDTVVVKGALPAYVYATATLNDIKPAYGSVIESETDNVVTLTFSEPVKVVYAQNLQSAGMMMPPTVNELTPVAVEADENGLATVWTVEMPLTPGFANISFAAEDAEGRRIWGNQGEEEDSYFSYEWQCTVGIPEVKVAPAGYVAGPVSTLTVTCAEQIDPYMGGGVVLNAAGEEVATIANMEKLVDENLEMWTPEWNEAMATAPVTITLSNEITEPGTYTVKFDAGLFMLNSGAYNSKATEATFAIIPAENLVEMNVERIVNLGYAADVVDVDLAAICEKLGVASISEATVWGVNATTLEYVADAMTEYDGWRNAEGDFTKWGNNHQVCYKYIADGAFQLCTEGGNEPAVGTEYTAYWAFSTASDTVVLKTNITFVAAPKVEMEIVKTITVNHYEKPNTSYSGNTATFDVNEVTEALGITSITEAEQYIMNVTDGSLVKNNTDGWRGANGDALGWGNPGGVCVKINDPASGIIDYIGCYDNAWNEGDSFVAKWAFVYDGKAVVIEVVIDFNTEMATGINGISAGDVVKTQYIGINGAVLNAPAKGVNIVKQTLKNGKVVTSKVYVK